MHSPNATQIRTSVRYAPRPRPARSVIVVAWIVGLAIVAVGLVIATRV